MLINSIFSAFSRGSLVDFINTIFDDELNAFDVNTVIQFCVNNAIVPTQNTTDHEEPMENLHKYRQHKTKNEQPNR
jgi:hypothetical protein